LSQLPAAPIQNQEWYHALMETPSDYVIVTQSLREQDWYRALIEDCDAVIVEGVHTSRWVLIETYHLLGTRLLEEWDNFERSKVYGRGITAMVALDLGKSKRTVERAVQFAREFPDLSLLPWGKNASWGKVIKLLSGGEDKDRPATYYNGLATLTRQRQGGWSLVLPADANIEAAAGDQVHIVIREGP